MNISKVFSLILCLSVCCCFSCKKGGGENIPDEIDVAGDIPVVTTVSADVSSITSAEVKGTIKSDGGLKITNRGVAWSTSQNPTIGNNKAEIGEGNGDFEISMRELKPKTRYYIRAYASNGKGIAYGNELTLYNENDKITVKTKDLIKEAHAEYGLTCIVTNEKGLVVNQAGICWSSNKNPTITDYTYKVYAPNQVIHVERLKVLRPLAKSTIYVRSYAITDQGTFYGNELSFDTPMDVGYRHAGGIIAYMNEEKTHGLVISEDTFGKMPWAPGNLFVKETFATSSSDGLANTDKIIDTYGSTGYAAFACRNFRGGGYSDWYLPSIEELTLMITTGLKAGFVGGVHWSSSEFSYQSGKALDFNGMYWNPVIINIGSAIKNSTCNLRAVRKF
jgi:hypothetical protein